MGTKMRRCIIFAAGPSRCRWISRISRGAFIICADAGYLKAEEYGIYPDLIVGDFDSSKRPDGARIVQFSSEKDDTDTLLAVKEGLRSGCDEFIIVGGTGGRLDHTLANISVLEYILRHGGTGWLVDNKMAITLFRDGQLCFCTDVDTTVSVFAWGSTAYGVTLNGLKYPLDDYTMTTDFPIGVSNESVDESVTISVKKGTLLVTITPVGNTFIEAEYNGV